MRGLLNHSDSELRFRAGETLLQLDAEKAQEDVMVLLNDPNVDVRSGIAYLLHEFGDQRAVDALVNLLLHDPDDDVRSNAALALGGIGSEKAVPALKWVILHDEGSNFQDEPIKNTAEWAIEQIRSAFQTS
ncbi:MAG: HEAT repeat domain-containing protein [Caldilineaceae bacterium]